MGKMMKQQHISDIKKFNAICYEQDASTDLIIDASKSRKLKLRLMVDNVSDKDKFAHQLNHIALNAAKSGKLPTFDSIPLTDIVLYSYHRIKKGDAGIALSNAIVALCEHDDLLVVPSFISCVENPNGTNNLPSFGEIALTLPLISYDNFKGFHSNIPQKEGFIINVTSRLLDGLDNLNLKFQDNFHLALSILRASNFEPDMVGILDLNKNPKGLTSNSISQAIEFELSKNIFEVDTSVISNLIESAYAANVPLNDIKVANEVSLEDTLSLINDEKSIIKFSSLSKQQIIDDLKVTESDRINHDFSATDYLHI